MSHEGTPGSVDLAEDVADVLSDLLDQTELAAKQRDPSIPEGTQLAEGDLEGQATVRYNKQSSMVRMNGVPVADRSTRS